MSNWDKEVDFLVVGSGGGGMAAAVVAHDKGLDTLVVEKNEYFGGTTALSGGVIWIANNHQMAGKDIADSEEDGFKYLSQVTKGEVDEARIRAYVKNGREMVEYMEQHSLVKFEAAEKYCDYYPELEGGKLGARSLDPLPFSRKKLKDELRHMVPSPWKGVLDRFSLTAKESHYVMDVSYKTILFILYRLAIHYLDISSRLKGLPDDRATLGQALIARLRRSLMDRNVPLWLSTPVEKLIKDGDRVVGLEVKKDGKTLRVKAKRGVLMATGGFAHNPEMRQKYQRGPIGSDWTAALETDTGEGILMGKDVGADLQFMDCAWWTPAIRLGDGNIWSLIVGKAMPGSIFVNSQGKRYTNEAAPYEDVVKGQYKSHGDCDSIPAYMIFDATYRAKYPIGIVPPSRVQPDDRMPEEYQDSDFFIKADTLVELANKIGIDAEGLVQTVEKTNVDARQGLDSEFSRGKSASDRYYSDAKNEPNPCLAPIECGPFYAIKVYPGDLGTKGGMKCDENARVLDESGQPIPGLYATGNCSGAVMGDSYPGAGSTIGPAMTFGYIAARHAANDV